MDTSIIGPVTVMESFINQFGQHSSAVHGILVSCILLCAAFGSLFAGRLADRLGRPKAMAFGAAVFTVGTVLEAAASELSMFAVGRVIEGIGYGLYFSTQTVYICEIAPPKARGPLTSGPQFMTCVALVAGYFISYGTVNIPGSLSWRLPFIVTAVMALFYLLINLFLLPESPRWLIRRRNFRAAEKVWDALEVRHEDREVDDRAAIADSTLLYRAHHHSQIHLQREKANHMSAFEVYGLGRCGSRHFGSVFDGFPPAMRHRCSSSIPATLLADKWGRRTSTLVGGVGLTALMILIGSLYAGHAVFSTHGAGRWVVIVSIYLYCIVQATTWGISIKVWAPEIQPQHTRAQAISLAYGANWVCNFFVAFVCPILLDKSIPSAYFLFGGCTAVATVVSFFYMVETKGKTLSEIEREFKARIPAVPAVIPMVRLSHADHGSKAA
ncbi:putative MFS transporter [Aspergillus fischeri NRRL 181]|uniref:MFS transporter, putative n=1 Tax=Neosartorya fischeri (strain ATCC 1020 / DSM 3700 / CBS 544.65 / FGSC A1164 / JCM 1740 / NRRL 181 / WB 181) TaxID=331117 RepID=A1DBS1_NEOFI|nr:MFS transporter, putative [Aspergillus fischeri NRRL 181]EAW20311.1 MFS transporter, putative [Aspergillus fischeri NRRL 181]